MAACRWLIVLLLAAALCAPGPAEAYTLTDPAGLSSALIGDHWVSQAPHRSPGLMVF